MVYLTQSIMADNQYLKLRVSSCAAQEGCADAGIVPDEWTIEWRRVWAAGEGWALAWEKAINEGVEEPGKDPTVISDQMVLDQVNKMKPFTRIEDNRPKDEPWSQASRQFVTSHTDPLNQTVIAIRKKIEENFPDLPWDIVLEPLAGKRDERTAS